MSTLRDRFVKKKNDEKSPSPSSITAVDTSKYTIKEIGPTKPSTIPKTTKKSTTPRRRKRSETKLMDVENLLNNITKVIQKELADTKEELLKLKPLENHIFNEENFLRYCIWNERKVKPKKTYEFFSTTDDSITMEDIKSLDKQLQEQGFIATDKNGWRYITSEGRKRFKQLTEVN